MRRSEPVLHFVTLLGDDEDLDSEFSSLEAAVEHAQEAVRTRQVAEVAVHQIRSTTAHLIALVNARGTEMVGEVIEPPSAEETAALRSRRRYHQLGGVTLRRGWHSTSIVSPVAPQLIRDRLGARRWSDADDAESARVREVELETMSGFTVEFGVTAKVSVVGEGVGKAALTTVSASFRPSLATAAWTLFTGCLAAVGVFALIETIVVGHGPLLWPLGGIGMFGGFVAWMAHIAVRCRRRVEADLLAAASQRR